MHLLMYSLLGLRVTSPRSPVKGVYSKAALSPYKNFISPRNGSKIKQRHTERIYTSTTIYTTDN